MDIVTFERAVHEADVPRDLWVLVVEFARQFPARRMAYRHFPPVGAPDEGKMRFASEGFEPSVIDEYIEAKLYRANVRQHHALRAPEPFYWDEIPGRVPTTREGRRLLALWEELHLSNGLGVPLFGPGGRNGYFGLELSCDTRLPTESVMLMQGACQLAHLRYCAMLIPTLGPTPELSERETDVLGLAAHGQNNGQIAEVLGISAHTVDAHLRRIYLKLGVMDRTSASVKGIGTGILHADTAA